MTTTLEAIYENGWLKLPSLLPLPEKSPVVVTIQTPAADDEAEHAAWLKLSEQALSKPWDNPEDDVFNELLKK
ncbi:MAG: DUF104 domain-containing protein [Verrucomicrobia bacterium]|nr:DUF104 domain-containing protein [Verrucomicrobiota bacterium]